ncbi:unnamed protein product [Gongylonema pulchrum]|uniref:Protein kinase domain-containing protein n=1 Tax=Gongylonema pulchrum TaxID=637853 RepID=A0A183DC33_9BILA|nr:unnamed protein product [Gongylonema pulchrum]
MNFEYTAEEDLSAPINFKVGRKWKIKNKLDAGGFGQVYRVEHMKRKGEYAALKAEPNNVEGGSAIKLELKILDFFFWFSNSDYEPHLLTLI